MEAEVACVVVVVVVVVVLSSLLFDYTALWFFTKGTGSLVAVAGFLRPLLVLLPLLLVFVSIFDGSPLRFDATAFNAGCKEAQVPVAVFDDGINRCLVIYCAVCACSMH